RARGPRADGRGTDEYGHQRAALPERADGRGQRPPHLRQARPGRHPPGQPARARRACFPARVGPVVRVAYGAWRSGRGEVMADIADVVVLMLENGSYDHMLGYVPHPDPSFDGLLGGTFTNPRWGLGPAVPASPDAKQVLPVGPDHSHDAVMEQLALFRGTPRNRGFVRSY